MIWAWGFRIFASGWGNAVWGRSERQRLFGSDTRFGVGKVTRVSGSTHVPASLDVQQGHSLAAHSGSAGRTPSAHMLLGVICLTCWMLWAL